MKISVIHPGKQHSHKVVETLYKNNKLQKFYTIGYAKNKNLLILILRKLPFKITRNLLEELESKRRIPNLPDEYVYTWSLLYFFLLKIASRKLSKKNYNKLSYFIYDKFQRVVVKKIIKEQPDAIISYEISSHIIFSTLRHQKSKIKKILDVSCPHLHGFKELFKESQKKSLILKDRRPDYPQLKSVFAKIMEEEMMADHLLVASSFAKECMIEDGVNEADISVLPYGVDDLFVRKSYKSSKHQKIRFLFVGRLTTRKGVLYLLEAFADALKKYSFLELTIVGGYHGNEQLVELYSSKSVRFINHINSRDKLKNIYFDHDVFILPSLSDGFGLVYIEALGMGLPIIGTYSSGAVDLINHKKNGYLIKSKSTEDILSAINFFVENREQLHLFSKRAIETTVDITWTNYENMLNTKLEQILSSGKDH